MSDSNDELSLFDSMSIEQLQTTVDQMSVDFKKAKIALREKRLSGVRAAIDARREADADLNEELRKIGYTGGNNSLWGNNSQYSWLYSNPVGKL